MRHSSHYIRYGSRYFTLRFTSAWQTVRYCPHVDFLVIHNGRCISTRCDLFGRCIVIRMATLNCVYLNHLVESRFDGEIDVFIFGSLGVRHVVWTVTYVTVHRVPTVLLSLTWTKLLKKNVQLSVIRDVMTLICRYCDDNTMRCRYIAVKFLKKY